MDKMAAPQSLEDLKNAGLFARNSDRPDYAAEGLGADFEDVVLSPTQSGTGITNVHSASTQVSRFENTPYSTW